MSDDIVERLRRKAQNEQTALGLAELLRLKEAECDALRAEVEALRDSIRAAFIAGCMAVHENHDPSDRHPDFSEAADDYLASIEDALEEKK